jgi:putative membrane-bound dehydrogenase-like protein
MSRTSSKPLFEHPAVCVRIASLLLGLLSLSISRSPVAGDDFPPPYNSPSESALAPMAADEAAARMQVPDGFRVSVFASEPMVQNPIAISWDEKGRLWVAENFTYADRQQRFDLSLRDRVLVLRDTDGDGRADQRNVFTDQVQMLTSVEVGRGGVWLMCPPQLLFIPDRDEDGVADGRAQVVLDGFTIAQDNYHNFANGLRWGPDGWLYGRCGHSCPGRLGPPGTPEDQRIPLDGGIWRYHPERKVVEVLCHGTVNPWGHDWDQHGELFFINTVIGHLWHLMPGAHFKESFGQSLNPAVYERIDMIADHYHFDTNADWTASRDGAANDFGGGHAHIGMLIYQGQQWPEPYRNRLFTLNMHGRRVNVERLERYGAGYVGRHEPDLLLSADPFFRGMELTTGPDGSVYVVDWSDTGECHEHTGVHRTSGRIYKVTYGQPDVAAPLIKPACAAGDGPLATLWRDYRDGRTTADSLRGKLSDPDEHLRTWAIRLLTDQWPLDTVTGPSPHARHPDDPLTRQAFVELARDDPRGLIQLALASTLQRTAVEHRESLASELIQHESFAQDRDLPLLVWYGLIPVAQRDPQALVRLAAVCRWPKLLGSFARFLAGCVESAPQPLDELLHWASTQPLASQRAVLEGIHAGLQGWRKAPSPSAWPAFAAGDAARQDPLRVQALDRLFGAGRPLAELRTVALDPQQEIKTRQAALEAFIEQRPGDLREVCESLLSIRDLNLTAARGLSTLDDPAIGSLLAANYRRFQPVDRPKVLELLASRPAFAAALLTEVGKPDGPIARSDITPALARQIRNLAQSDLTRRLAEVWGELRDSPADKVQQIAELRGHLTPEALAAADRNAGRALFTQRCAQCHMLFGQGQRIGPELTGAQRANLDYLLENILDPSAVVGNEYRMKNVTTTDGRVLGGLIVAETPKILTLQTPTEQITIPLDEIEAVQATSLSSMPEGLLTNLSADEMLDLFAYLSAPTP